MANETDAKRFLGCCLALGAAVALSLATLCFTYIQNVYFMESITIRTVVPLLLILPYIIAKKLSVFGQERGEIKWLVLNGICYTGRVTLYLYALTVLPIADLSALFVGGSMTMVSILACLVLKESCGVFETVVVLAVIVGTVLVAQPKALIVLVHGGGGAANGLGETRRLVGVGAALASCFCSGWMFVSARRLCHLHFAVTLFHGYVWTIVVSGLFTTVNGAWSIPHGRDWLYLAGFSFNGFLALTLLYQALKFEKASIVGAIQCLEIALSYLLQVTIVKVYPTVYSILGAVLISLTSFACGFRAWLISKSDVDCYEQVE